MLRREGPRSRDLQASRAEAEANIIFQKGEAEGEGDEREEPKPIRNGHRPQSSTS